MRQLELEGAAQLSHRRSLTSDHNLKVTQELLIVAESRKAVGDNKPGSITAARCLQSPSGTPSIR